MNYFKMPKDLKKLIEIDLTSRSNDTADTLLQIYNENVTAGKIDSINELIHSLIQKDFILKFNGKLSNLIMHFLKEIHQAEELKEDWDYIMGLQDKTDSETTSEAASKRSQTIESFEENDSNDNEEDSDYNPDTDSALKINATKFAYASKLKQQIECADHLKEINDLNEKCAALQNEVDILKQFVATKVKKAELSMEKNDSYAPPMKKRKLNTNNENGQMHYWKCQMCTFNNENMHALCCAMCTTFRNE